MIADHVGVSQPMVSRHRAARSATEKVFQSPTRAGRDGRRINTSNIRHSNQRRREAPTISRHAFQPVRTGSRPLPMTALNMPHDPVMGAKTLIELFGADYLRALVEFLSKHLQGEKR